MNRLAPAALLACLPLAAHAADIVLTPPAGGGVAITNAVGGTTRLRVADDGLVTLPGLTALPVAGTGLCIDAATGRIGTCTLAGGAGTVTSLVAGTGLTGGTITTSGTIAADTTFLQRRVSASCAAGSSIREIAQDGTVTCQVDNVGTGTVNGVFATAPLASSGGATPNLSFAGGADGQVLAWSGGAAGWTANPAVNRLLLSGAVFLDGFVPTLPGGAPEIGRFFKGGVLFMHGGGTSNTALGREALNPIGQLDGPGAENTAIGAGALGVNRQSSRNTAVGFEAMGGLNFDNAGAPYNSENTAVGYRALFSVTPFTFASGRYNTALGGFALTSIGSGSGNVAVGHSALTALGGASGGNTAVGAGALFQLGSGTDNIAIGPSAGQLLTSGSSNIYVGNAGVASESATTRIGHVGTTRTFLNGIRGTTTGANDAVAVVIDSNGQLGTVSSSRRFKDDIADMGEASGGLMDLRPVTFTYKADGDPAGKRVQYGLIAEEVAEVYPGLVARAPDGQAETVLYHFLAPMIVNEVQKQQRTIEAQRAELDSLRAELDGIKRALGLAR